MNIQEIDLKLEILKKEIANVNCVNVRGGYSGNDRWRDHESNLRKQKMAHLTIANIRNKMTNLTEQRNIILKETEKIRKEEEIQISIRKEECKQPILSLEL